MVDQSVVLMVVLKVGQLAAERADSLGCVTVVW